MPLRFLCLPSPFADATLSFWFAAARCRFLFSISLIFRCAIYAFIFILYFSFHIILSLMRFSSSLMPPLPPCCHADYAIIFADDAS